MEDHLILIGSYHSTAFWHSHDNFGSVRKRINTPINTKQAISETTNPRAVVSN